MDKPQSPSSCNRGISQLSYCNFPRVESVSAGGVLIVNQASSADVSLKWDISLQIAGGGGGFMVSVPLGVNNPLENHAALICTLLSTKE